MLLPFAMLACSPSDLLGSGVVTFDGDDRAALQVEVADSPSERATGLMGVTALPPDDGMAFVWDDTTTATFWMKDTVVPLSVAFVDGAGRIVSITDMDPCRTDPCPTYRAAAPYVLAVEANQGWFADHGVAVGDRAELDEAGP